MKFIRNVATILIAILGVFFLSTTVHANETSMTLNITDERPFTPNETPKYTVLRGTKDYSIFKIGEKKNNDFDFNKALYCLRAGVGFGDSERIADVSEISDVL